MTTTRIGVIGDIHCRFDDEDVAYFNRSPYDLLLFVGDVAGYRRAPSQRAARRLAGITKPSLLIPGNHDGPTILQLLAEVLNNRAMVRVTSGREEKRVAELRRHLGGVELCGYSLHRLSEAGASFDIVAARPHTMGGPTLAFAPYLNRRFGVTTLAESAALIKARIDESSAERLIILAHNGPTGLGDRRDDIYGVDFKPAQGDFGDPDLEAALAHARAIGKRVLAVVAGHMHHRLRGGGQRRWRVARDGVLYLNAACVPRIFERDGASVRHHVSLTVDGDGARAEEVVVTGADI